MRLFRVRLNPRRSARGLLTVVSVLILGVLGATFVMPACMSPTTSSDDSEALQDTRSTGLRFRWFNDENTPPYVTSEPCPPGDGAMVRDDMENPACLLVMGCCTMSAWFWDFDIIRGPLHANTRINLYNSADLPPCGARFYDRVTSASSRFRCAGYDEGGGCPEGYATFYDGYELNFPAVDCFVEYTEAEICADPQSGGLLLPQHETWITLNNDGTMWVYQPDGDPPYSDEPNGVLLPLPSSGVVGLGGTDVDGDIHLQGTLNGKLTILAGRKIYVEGDILFNVDPRFGRSKEKLGLLAGWMTPAEGHLVIPDVNPAGPDGNRMVFGNYIGPHCNASLMVEAYQQRANEGLLTIYGSIFEGILRPTQSSDGQHGYMVDIAVDPRVCFSPPPCFPTLEWEE